MIRRLVYPATDWLAALIAGERDTATPAGLLALEHFTSNEEPRTLCDNCVRRVSSEPADDGWPLCGLLVLTDARSPTSARDAAFDVKGWRERVGSGWAPHPCPKFVPKTEIEATPKTSIWCQRCRTTLKRLDDEGFCEECRTAGYGACGECPRIAKLDSDGLCTDCGVPF